MSHPSPSHSVYIGGTRGFYPSCLPIAPVVRAVLASGCSIHVGCQSGVDQSVVFMGLLSPLSLVVFAVAPSLALAPAHVERAYHAGAQVVLSAGGNEEIPLKARYLLRSKAAFAGCGQALFFQPGKGSLAVARECVKSGLPVFAFTTAEPAPIPSTAGTWSFVHPYSYYAPFSSRESQVWQWQSPASLF